MLLKAATGLIAGVCLGSKMLSVLKGGMECGLMPCYLFFSFELSFRVND